MERLSSDRSAMRHKGRGGTAGEGEKAPEKQETSGKTNQEMGKRKGKMGKGG